MPVTAAKPGPYAPAATVIEVLNRSRARGLPTPVNVENLARIGVPESLGSRVLYSLIALDLIDESGTPTATLENLRLAPEAEYKKRQEDWLKSAYADIFGIVDPTNVDEVHVRDAFRGYQPVGQQSRMVTLFLGLCANAGMVPEKTPSTTRPRSASSPRATVTPAQRQAINKVQTKIISNAKKPSASSGLPPALAGLLESLPDSNVGWTKGDRDKFYSTFGTVLDFCIPIRTIAQMHETGSQE